MKVLGVNSSSVIVELEYCEWLAIGGDTKRNERGYVVPDVEVKPPKIAGLVDALRKIKNASPELQRIRAAFQSFLLLTEPAVVEQVLNDCGVAEPVKPEQT